MHQGTRRPESDGRQLIPLIEFTATGRCPLTALPNIAVAIGLSGRRFVNAEIVIDACGSDG